MIIRATDFLEKEEMDFSASFHNRGRYGRVSVRRAMVSVLVEEQEGGKLKVTERFETFIFWHRTLLEEILHTGSLTECVRLANLLTGTGDEVQE